MKRTTLIAAVFAVLIMATGFAAAAPGNAPVDVDTGAASPDDHANTTPKPAGTDTNPQDASEHDDHRENGVAADRNGQGPAIDLPTQVPDHVSAIHDRISSFLSGDLEGTLGDAISELTPDDGEEQTESDDGSDEQTESNDSVEQTDSSDDTQTEA